MAYTKDEFLGLIQSHIEKYGYHITIVSSRAEPRYAYTIGLRNVFHFELIFAGGINYLKDDLSLIFDTIIEELKNGKTITDVKFNISALGVFTLAKVDVSWSNLMMLGVLDFYKIDNVNAFQIVPDADHYTLDIPDMTKELNVSLEPVWQWLIREWDYPVPENSTVITNIDALQGKAITELTRWENDEWEMFAGAGPDMIKEELRVVSLGTILGIDETLVPAIYLNVGEGLWRESAGSTWNNWN